MRSWIAALCLWFVASTSGQIHFEYDRVSEFFGPEEISGDGTVVIGRFNGGVGGIWSLGQPPRRLPGLGGTSGAIDASYDGSVVAGYVSDGGDHRACRWVNEELELLGFEGEAQAVSADGTELVVSQFGQPNGKIRFWSESKGLGAFLGQGAISCSAGRDALQVFVASSDLSVILGRAGGAGNEVFRWTKGMGIAPVTLNMSSISGDGNVLLTFDGLWRDRFGEQRIRDYCRGISGDGGVVVGADTRSLGDAFVWTESEGVRFLETVLCAAGELPSGFRLQDASAISDNGRVIVGTGSDSTGGFLWRVTIEQYPLPRILGDTDASDTVDLDDLAAVLASFGEPEATLDQGDADGDGDVDLVDLAIVLGSFGSCSF